jgi:hypothetical protein
MRCLDEVGALFVARRFLAHGSASRMPEREMRREETSMQADPDDGPNNADTPPIC